MYPFMWLNGPKQFSENRLDDMQDVTWACPVDLGVSRGSDLKFQYVAYMTRSVIDVINISLYNKLDKWQEIPNVHNIHLF